MILRRLAGFLSLAMLVTTSFGQSQGYAQRVQNIHAAVLTMDATRYTPLLAANYTPFVWLNMDSNSKVKPAGWSFSNPNAPGVVDGPTATRWQGIDTFLGTPGGPNPGDLIDKHKAAYWELSLSSASDTQLAQYNILLFSGYNFVSLNPAEREKLRRYVDRGGILWVDLYHQGAGSLVDIANNLPLPVVDSVGNGQLTFADIFHPILSTPNRLGISDLESISTDGDHTVMNPLFFADINGLDELLEPLPEDSLKMNAVAGVGSSSVLAVGHLGDGFIIVTTRGYANALNRVLVAGNQFNPNNLYQSVSPNPDPTQDTAAKLVVNMINLGSGYAQTQGGSRKQNSSFVDIGQPLLKRFDAPTVGGHNVAVEYKGLLVVTTDTQVIVYDSNPAADLDGDGNPDDGRPDYALGAGYDEVWESTPLNGPISPAVCAEIPNGNGVPADQIIVTDGNGNVVGFNAFPTNANGTLASGPVGPAYTVNNPNAGNLSGGPYPAPTVHENLIVVGDTINTGFGNPGGQIWLADARNGSAVTSTNPFQLGNGILPEFSASPVVGYIPIADNSGGVDRVIYTPGLASTNGAFPTANVTSIWIGAKGESPGPTSVTATPTMLTVETRAAKAGLPIYFPSTTPLGNGLPPPGSGLGVKITVMDPATGDPWTAAQMAAKFGNTLTQGQPGELEFGLINGGLPMQPDGVTPNVAIRVDYTIDWGALNAASASAVIRGSIGFPDDVSVQASSRRHILGNLALSPRGTLYAVVSTGDPSSANTSGGSFYEMREEGRGAFRMLVRYDLYPPFTIPLSGVGNVLFPATVDDNDALTNLPNVGSYLGGPFNRLTFTGGPSVQNGIVYVTAQGRKNGASPVQQFIPFAILMAFKGEPDNPTIRVGDFPDGSTIVQPDITITSGGQKSTPNRYDTLQNAGNNSQYTYDSNTGIVTINNLSNVNRGQVGSALSLSLPVIVKSPNGAPDRWFWPDANGSNWSPLLWYTVKHGASNNSAPFATGNSVFMAGTSALPSLIQSNFSSIKPNGLGWGMDATISPSDPYVVTNAGTGRPWINQVENLKINGGSPTNPNVTLNPDMRWPQQVGSISYDTWIQRILQTQIGSTASGFATQGTGVLGGDRSLILIGQNSAAGTAIYSGFSRSDIVVADQGRVARFDPGGNPIWSTDLTLATGLASTGPTTDMSGLVRPTRAYLFGDSDVLAVDPATNRIMRLDATGHEVRSISGFKLDTTYTPDGYKVNEKTKFDSPADVATFNEFVPGPRLAANPMSNAQPLELWSHYVVADSGNHRIVDVVDRYVADPVTRRVLGPVQGLDGTPQLGVLAWHTPASLDSKQFFYTSITRIVPTTVGGGGYYYLAGVGNTLPTRTDVGLVNPSNGQTRQEADGNGGIVILDPLNVLPPDVISEVQMPDVPANVFWNDQTGTFNSTAQPAHLKKLSSLSSITARNVGNSTSVMFTDATGVYEIVPGGSGWIVQWMMPNEAYRVMRGVHSLYDTGGTSFFATPGKPDRTNPADLRATYARRLDSGEVLIVNGYSGQSRGNDWVDRGDANVGLFTDRLAFGGEVIQVDGGVDALPINPANPNVNPGFSFNKTNFGFGYLSIKFQLPPISGARQVLQPVFADRR